MVFGGQITFSTPPKEVRTQIFFRPPIFFFGPPIFFRPFATNHAARHPPHLIFVQILKGGVGGAGGGEGKGGNPKKKKTAPPDEKRLKKKSAWAGDQSAAFFFSALRKRPKPKIGFFGGRPRSKGLDGFDRPVPHQPAHSLHPG